MERMIGTVMLDNKTKKEIFAYYNESADECQECLRQNEMNLMYVNRGAMRAIVNMLEIMGEKIEGINE